MSGEHSDIPFRFMDLPFAGRKLDLQDNGTIVTRTEPSGLRIVYLNRRMAVDEELILSVEKIRNRRKTFTIALGATTCDPVEVVTHEYHATARCDPESCPTKGRSVVSFFGLPFGDKKQSFTSIHSFISIRGDAQSLIFVTIDDHTFTCTDPDGIFQTRSAFPFVILTGDIRSVTIVKHRLPDSPASQLDEINPAISLLPQAVADRFKSFLLQKQSNTKSSPSKISKRAEETAAPTSSPAVPTSSSIPVAITDIASPEEQAIAGGSTPAKKKKKKKKKKMDVTSEMAAAGVDPDKECYTISAVECEISTAGMQISPQDTGTVAPTSEKPKSSTSFEKKTKPLPSAAQNNDTPNVPTKSVAAGKNKKKNEKKKLKKQQQQQLKPGEAKTKESAPPVAAVAPDAAVDDSEIDPDLVHPKWSLKPPPGFNPLPASVESDASFTDSVVEDLDSFEEIVGKKKKKSKIQDERRFAFLSTSYNHNIEIKEKNRVAVRKDHDPELFSAVYLNRELDADRRLCLKIEKVGNSVSGSRNCFNIGVTTCDPEIIAAYECHKEKTCWKKSPCGGFSTSFSILKCKGNSQYGTIVTLEKREACIIVGAGDWFRTQLTDNMSLFQERNAYPFVVMNGSVSCIKIIEDPEHFSAPLSFIPKSITPADAASSISRDIGTHFVVPLFAADNMRLSNRNRTVTRETLTGSRIVYLNHPIEIDGKISLRIEDSAFVSQSSCSFMLGMSTCDFSSLERVTRHGAVSCSPATCGGSCFTRTISSFADAGTVVLIERKTVFFNVTMIKQSGQKEMFIDPGSVPNVRYFYPYLLMSGNAVSIHILDDHPTTVTRVPLTSNSYDSLLVDVDANEITQPEYPSPSFERGIRDAAPLVFRRPATLSLESPPVSTASTEPKSPPLIDTMPSNYPGVNSNGHSAASFNSYDMQNLNERNTPTDWSQMSSASGSRLSSPVPVSQPEPRERPFKPSNSNGFESIIDSKIVASSPAPSTRRVNENRTASLFIQRKWYSNAYVRFADQLMTRLRSPADRNYIFSSELRVNEKITFKVVQVDENLTSGSLTFGLTTIPILKIDFSSLPPDTKHLKQKNCSKQWLTSHNLYNCVGSYDGLTIQRTRSGISLSLESEDSTLQLIPDVDAGAIIYPFFHMSGCVKAIQLIPGVEPLRLQDRIRLYLIFFYLTILNRYALDK